MLSEKVNDGSRITDIFDQKFIDNKIALMERELEKIQADLVAEREKNLRLRNNFTWKMTRPLRIMVKLLENKIKHNRKELSVKMYENKEPVPLPSYDQNLPIAGPALTDFDDRFLLGREKCPACESKYIVPVRYLPGRGPMHNTMYKYMLRYCLRCHSFWTSPEFIEDPREIVVNKPISSINCMQHHNKWYTINKIYGEVIFEDFSKLFKFSSILEIDCGIGSTLSVADAMGKKVLGYDIDETAVNAGKERFHIPLVAENWTKDTVKCKYDLVMSIACLEHFIRPLNMIHELASYCQKYQSILYIVVPLAMPDKYEEFCRSNPSLNKRFFSVLPDHWTYFSSEALGDFFFKNFGVSSYFFKPRQNGALTGILIDFRKIHHRLSLDKVPTLSSI